VHDAAYALPMHMIADIVGIPESDRAYVFERVDGYMIAGDPEVAITPEQKQAMEREIFEYGVALAARKRADPGDDVWSILTRAELPTRQGGATRLSDFELALFFHVLALAGSETTRNSIAGGLLALLDHPAQLERFRRESESRDRAAHEIIRWTSPARAVVAHRDARRRARRREDRRGRTRLDLDRVGEPRRIGVPAPDRFDIARDPNPHVAFGGGGAHYCLGSHLAQRQVARAVRGALRRCARDRAGRRAALDGLGSSTTTFPARSDTCRFASRPSVSAAARCGRADTGSLRAAGSPGGLDHAVGNEVFGLTWMR
jgi:cytochrome P450